MKHYIGTKLIAAVPAWRITGPKGDTILVDKHRDCAMEEGSTAEDGYRVRYPDGYESWSPKEVFEKAYLPMGQRMRMLFTGTCLAQER